jgi:hypothetical protein
MREAGAASAAARWPGIYQRRPSNAAHVAIERQAAGRFSARLYFSTSGIPREGVAIFHKMFKNDNIEAGPYQSTALYTSRSHLELCREGGFAGNFP